MVEVAVLIPVAMFLVLLGIQACLWAHAATIVQNAAAEAEQEATLAGGSGAAADSGAEKLLTSTGSNVVEDPSVHVTEFVDGVVEVRVTGAAEAIIPGLHLPVSATRVGLIQEFRPSG